MVYIEQSAWLLVWNSCMLNSYNTEQYRGLNCVSTETADETHVLSSREREVNCLRESSLK